jgi:toxin ParE1/3/4
MKYEFHPDALVELEDSADFYFGQHPGLEQRFLDSIDSAISRILEYPVRWRIFDGEIRRYLVHVFPYAILYSVEDELIYIIAEMHCGREPDYWKSRRPQT